MFGKEFHLPQECYWLSYLDSPDLLSILFCYLLMWSQLGHTATFTGRKGLIGNFVSLVLSERTPGLCAPYRLGELEKTDMHTKGTEINFQLKRGSLQFIYCSASISQLYIGFISALSFITYFQKKQIQIGKNYWELSGSDRLPKSHL